MDRDLLEVDHPAAAPLCTRQHRYTVTQVGALAPRSDCQRYNGVYRAIETVLDAEALAAAAREDRRGGRGHRGACSAVGHCRSSSRPTPVSPGK
jgi:hypothetical protein